MLTRFVVVIILQNIQISNHYIVHLKPIYNVCQLYLNNNKKSKKALKKMEDHATFLNSSISSQLSEARKKKVKVK